MHQFIRITLWGLLLLMTGNARAQFRNEDRTIEITFNKTTSIVFPAMIKSVDRGSRDVLAQKAKGVENVLQLKAARHGFTTTNLTVITSDGNIHEFTVNYTDEPESLVLNMGDNPDSYTLTNPDLIFQTELNEMEMELYASRIIEAKRSVRFLNETRHGISISLRGIFIKDNVMFYHFRIKNRSNISYDVNFLRLYIEDRQKVRRTASQEVGITPIYVFGNANEINGQSTNDVVFALDKFTIPGAKRLVIEMFERNGGRNLTLSINNKAIVNARLID
ncbi:MAG TPA: conjugative transposon protein TraN [Cyclobacteriaceae bacterium]|nr:conjugative transposon protein TraN [Cyclobacteriaceae bacterium]